MNFKHSNYKAVSSHFRKTKVTATTEWRGQKTFIKAIKTSNLNSK